MKEKECKKCLNVKAKDLFLKSTRSLDGYLNFCKDCEAKKKKEHYLKNKQQYIDRSKEWKSNNKEKVIISDQKYRFNNIETEKLRGLVWQKENKEKCTAKTRRYQEKNKEKVKLSRLNYQKNRLKNDELFRIKKRISDNIRNAINQNGFYKTSSTKDILGCDPLFFKSYIESQFTKDMNWKNIHLDHINPVSKATSIQEIHELNHYTNFQPLLASDNIKKSNKLIEKQLRLI